MKNSFSKADERIKNYKERTSDTKQDTETIELCNYIITYKKEKPTKGGCGSVHIVTTYTPKDPARRTLRDVCLKKAITKRDNELILTEIKIYDRINERIKNNTYRRTLNIPDPDCFDYTPNDSQYPAYIMEYLKGETPLAEWFLTNENVTKKELVEKLYEVFITLYHLHHIDGEQGYIHCDIKTDNIVFQKISQGMNTRECLKLIDFGLCHGTNHETINILKPSLFNPPYPKEIGKKFYELDKGLGVGPEYDVYCMCCSIYYLLAAKNYKVKNNYIDFIKGKRKIISDYTESKQSFIEQIKFYCQIRKDTKLNRRETCGLLRGLSWKKGRQLIQMCTKNDANGDICSRASYREGKNTLWYYFNPKVTKRLNLIELLVCSTIVIFGLISSTISFDVLSSIINNIATKEQSIESYPEGSILNMEWKDQELYEDFKEYYENNKEKTSLLENDCRNDVKSIFINNGTIMLAWAKIEEPETSKVTTACETEASLYSKLKFPDINGNICEIEYEEITNKTSYVSLDDLYTFFPSLEKLIIYNCDLSKKDIFTSITKLNQLENLEFRGCDVIDLDFISEMNNLTGLTIEASSSCKIMNKIPVSESLDYLLLKNFEEINLENLSELKELNLLGIDEGYDCVELKQELLSLNNRQIMHLHLSNADKEILPIIDLLSNQLASLMLVSSDFSDSTEEFVNSISNCSNLSCLTINNSSFNSLTYFEKFIENINKTCPGATINAAALRDSEKKLFALEDYLSFSKSTGSIILYDELYSVEENYYDIYDDIRKSAYETLIIDGANLYFSKESNLDNCSSVVKDSETGSLSVGEIKVDIDYFSNNTVVSQWSTRENPCLSLTELAYFFPYTKNLIIYNSNLNIDSECGIQYFSNLEKLYISNCNYIDCSVFDCDSLRSVIDLRIQNVKDVRNCSELTTLVDLQTLRLGHASIKLSELKGISDLLVLELTSYPYEMQKMDYDFIKDNNSIQEIMLMDVELNNELLIDSLSSKDRLAYLFLHDCSLNSLSYFENLSQLKNLEEIRITGSDISDWSPLDWCENVEGRPMDDS